MRQAVCLLALTPVTKRNKQGKTLHCLYPQGTDDLLGKKRQASFPCQFQSLQGLMALGTYVTCSLLTWVLLEQTSEDPSTSLNTMTGVFFLGMNVDLDCQKGLGLKPQSSEPFG